MDWINGIQRAIDYTEEHLCEETDFEMIAKQAASSSFHFQRIFSILCGYSLGEYIRMRRLTCAAEELQHNGAKVIDVALKYGYETPESFSRAFTRFHGITPSQAKHGETVRSFSRLSVKLILDGGNFMDYRIEKRDSFKVICKRKQVNKPQDDTASADISAFWSEVSSDGSIERLCKYADFSNLHGILGVCFSGEMAGSGFPYGIGAEYNGAPLTDDDFEIVEIPAYTYAVFQCKGKMPEAFTETYKKICSEFFPQSSMYEYGNGIEFEIYPSADVQNPDFTCEIMIAVNEK